MEGNFRKKNMFRGINAINIDPKGRLAVPTRYRDALTEEDQGHLVLTIDTEETCLLLYPREKWQLIEDKLQQLPSFNPTARRIQRLLMGHATDVELDSQGRILVPAELREYAKLQKKVVMIGQGNKFEVWDEQTWNTRREVWLGQALNADSSLPEDMKLLSL